MAQRVKNLPAMQETRVWALGQEAPLQKGMATHPSIHAWRIPWTEEPGELQSMESQRVRHNFTTKQQMKELMTTSGISIFLIFRTQRRFSLSEKKKKKALFDDSNRSGVRIQIGPLNSYLRLIISWWLWTFVSSSGKCGQWALITPSCCEEKEWDNVYKSLHYL